MILQTIYQSQGILLSVTIQQLYFYPGSPILVGFFILTCSFFAAGCLRWCKLLGQAPSLCVVLSALITSSWTEICWDGKCVTFNRMTKLAQVLNLYSLPLHNCCYLWNKPKGLLTLVKDMIEGWCNRFLMHIYVCEQICQFCATIKGSKKIQQRSFILFDSSMFEFS